MMKGIPLRIAVILLIAASPAALARAGSSPSSSLPRIFARCQQAVSATPQPAANPADVKDIDSILAALYDVISGPARKPRDWNRFRSLFAPGARLIPAASKPDGGYEARVFSAEDYISRATPVFEKSGFFERGIANRVETFGQIAHVFSTYESRHNADDKAPFARGINSIQLLNDGKRWWVVTVFWDSERPDNPLPPQYLPPARQPK